MLRNAGRSLSRRCLRDVVSFLTVVYNIDDYVIITNLFLSLSHVIYVFYTIADRQCGQAVRCELTELPHPYDQMPNVVNRIWEHHHDWPNAVAPRWSRRPINLIFPLCRVFVCFYFHCFHLLTMCLADCQNSAVWLHVQWLDLVLWCLTVKVLSVLNGLTVKVKWFDCQCCMVWLSTFSGFITKQRSAFWLSTFSGLTAEDVQRFVDCYWRSAVWLLLTFSGLTAVNVQWFDCC